MTRKTYKKYSRIIFMSIIVETSLDTLYQNVCSKTFIKNLFSMKDKESIKKYNDGKRMVFDRLYNVKELDDIEELKHIQIPDEMSNILEKHLGHIDVIFSTTHDVIKYNEECLILKYTSILTKPDIIYKIVGSAKLILYVKMTINKNDSSKITIQTIKRFVNVDTIIDDDLILNTDNNNILHNIYEDESLQINESIIKMSETLLGTELVQECIIPYINKLFADALNVIQDTYVSKMVNYLTKKHFKTYKKMT